MIKLLIGGSPCTYWSVAQKKGREVEAKGLGWELFKNYLIAKEKFKPDLFLYENNKSAAQPIKDQISRELGVDLMHINSALVSAQNRQRFYAFNWNVDQPADRGIMLKDILETTTSEKGYELRAPAVGVGCRNRREDDGKLYRRFETSGIPKANALTTVQPDSMVAEPIRIGTIENSAKKQSHDSKQYRVYSPEGKATTLCGEGGGLGAKTGLYAAPVRVGTMPDQREKPKIRRRSPCAGVCDRHTGGGYMSKSPPITITSEELRERVEEYLDRWIPDDVWNRSEPYARRKLDLCRERQPEVEYYNNEYLVLLAADTVRETEFSDFTLADYAAKMAARATS